MALNEIMLSHSDVLEAIDFSVDFMGNDASVAEHGAVLLAVNRAELCAEASLPVTEWWPLVHCMFENQACLTGDGGACAGMQMDDLAMMEAATEADLAGCDCSLDGVAAYCAETHASSSWTDITASCDVDALAVVSSARAAAADGGATLWVTINGERYAYEEGMAYGGVNTELGFGAWADRVFAVTCRALGADAPASCDAYTAPN